MIQPKQAVIYARVSTKDQSCERQIRDLNEFAAKAGYTVVATYQETASGGKNDRAERAKVLKLAQARKIDVILVTELTRWGRSTIDLISSLQDLQSRDVSLVAQTGLQLDLSTPQGKLMVTMLSGLAEFEKDLIKERISSGLQNAKAKGKVLGRQTGDNIAVDKHSAKIQALAAAGKPYRAIAAELGISTGTVTKAMKLAKSV